MSEYTINLKSTILAGPADLNVIVPGPQYGSSAKSFYTSGKKYKVLWLLHAGNGDRNDWLRSTNVARFVEGREVIVVMPTALNSDFANHPQFADGYNFSEFFFDELMPLIYNWFPASDQPQDNFISGFSMGAAGAWMYGLYRPEMFGGVAPVSGALKKYTFLEPYRALESGEFREKALADRTAFPSGYGNPASGIHLKEINMIAKYPTVGDFLDSYEHTWDRFREVVAAGRLPKIYMPCGTDDRNHQKVLQFKQYAEELGAAGITYDFIPGEGGGFGFCDLILPKMMDFFGIR
jgi:S-formylglutathione hydrolase FrmB